MRKFYIVQRFASVSDYRRNRRIYGPNELIAIVSANTMVEAISIAHNTVKPFGILFAAIEIK